MNIKKYYYYIIGLPAIILVIYLAFFKISYKESDVTNCKRFIYEYSETTAARHTAILLDKETGNQYLVVSFSGGLGVTKL